ncbi:MAG: cell division protein FtsL [Alphaproteobacteria bacterium]
MIKRATLIWMFLATAAGIGLFVLKYEVKSMEGQLATIHSKTLENLEAVHVLKAEWSYLNQPERLEDLGRRLLNLEPVKATQTIDIENIPFRPVGGSENNPNLTKVHPPAVDQTPPLFAYIRRKQ